MSRWSDPDEGLTQDRFRVWDLGDDLYSRAQLEENWDTLDAILGRPADGVTVWPPLADRGIGGGIWALIEKLQNDKAQLGDVKWVWVPTQNALTAVVAAAQTAGWEVANGQSISSGNHDMEELDGSLSSSAIRLPNMIDHTVVGVAHDSTVGEVGGITTNNGTDNVGAQGAATATFTVSISAHTHSVPSHAHTTDGHVHGMQHRHRMYNGHTIPSSPFYDEAVGKGISGPPVLGTVYNLKSSAYTEKTIYGFDDGLSDQEIPSGWANPVVGIHKHWQPESVTGLGIRSSGTVVANTTETGGAGSTGSWSGTTGSDGASTSNHEIDLMPLSVGLVPFIKVRHATAV